MIESGCGDKGVTGRHTACHNKPAMTSSSSHWVLREQVRLLYDNSLSANAALLVISVILVLALHISIDPWPLWTWFGLVAASVCVRLLLLRDYRRDPEPCGGQ